VFPLSILEAAASSTPIICSDIRTLRTVAEGYDSPILVAPSDVDALSNALERLATSPSWRERCSVEARAFAADHQWNDVARRYEELLTSLC
jgi:glycosyltransferase involved in cell wall biosynthesis